MPKLSTVKQKQVLRKLVKRLEEIENLKTQLGIKRDEIRSKINDVEEILQTADFAILDFDAGLRDFQTGLDTLSQYI